jgi:hypothetical protein
MEELAINFVELAQVLNFKNEFYFRKSRLFMNGIQNQIQNSMFLRTFGLLDYTKYIDFSYAFHI